MHDFLTVAIPFAHEHADAVDAELDRLGNPAEKPVRDVLRGAGVHFMSMCVVRGGSEHQTYLVLEGSCDHDLATVIAQTFSQPFRKALEAASIRRHDEVDLLRLCRRHTVRVRSGPFGTPGLNFTGTPSMSVDRIRKEYLLSRRVREIIESTPRSGTALRILEATREEIQKDEELAPLLTPEETPILDPVPVGGIPLAKVVLRALIAFGWPYALLVLVVSGLIGVLAGILTVPLIGVVAGLVLVLVGIVGFVVLLGWLYSMLRRQEEADVPDDSTLDANVLGEVLRRESKTAQNHLGGATTMKPGFLRRLTIRIVFWVIGNTAPYRSRPGFLGELGTIHFARWVLLPGTDKLLFFSNYGGSWESYLEDFITKAHGGLTGVWSNTMGFPRTKNLFGDGATDGDRFKRWARRYQWPTRFWYSAYPHLTTARIRLNAAIRQGLATASTEDEASDWISCFGSRPRGNSVIETPEVQSIMFGGMASLPHAECLLLSLPDDVSRAKEWLKTVEPLVSFGDHKPRGEALILSLTSSGLTKMGCGPEILREFPIAFQQGMSTPHRAAMLGDTGEDKPSAWLWGHGDKTVDVALLVYADSQEKLDSRAASLVDLIESHQGAVVHRIDTEDMTPGETARERFGFADGISQPIIRGTKRWTSESDPSHVVEPGEIMLGYRDNRGFVPITPTVKAPLDPDNILPVARANAPDTELPNFTDAGGTSPRDLGRNGSFLVIRQLQQHKEQFDQYLSEAAAQLVSHPAMPAGLTASQREHWIAAKMVGRWRDGTSLVRFPNRPGNGWDCDEDANDGIGCAHSGESTDVIPPDNSFLLGADDPLGFRCPFGAHIRRSNPRESMKPGSDEQLVITNRHRILRMGRNYVGGESDPDERGLLFMCLNADIERQFEFIQQTWAMSPHFHGLDGEVDPILGRGGKSGRLTIPTPDGPILVSGMNDFVTTRGGGYFFMPGRRAIWYLTGEIPAEQHSWVMQEVKLSEDKGSAVK